MRPSLRLNVLAGFGGRALNALLAFLFVPVYVKLLGVESFGLIGFFATLYATLNLLDLGLSSTLNRELARLSAMPGEDQRQRDLVRTLEVIYWLTAAAVGVAIVLSAPGLARYWIQAKELPARTVTTALSLMGLVFVFQFPFGLYQGGLMGLQRHVVLNGVLGGTALVRTIGAVGVLLWISPTITAYFVWQAACSAAQAILLRTCLWKTLPSRAEQPRFRKTCLSSVWRFAAGMTGIALTAVVLSNLDKVLLSKLLPLDRFGYYMVGASVSSGLLALVSPFFLASFPRFSQMIASGRQEELNELYHLLCQAVTCTVLPVAMVIAVFPSQFLFAWTRNPDLVEHSSLIVQLLVVGTGINAVMNVPYALQLADGWTKFAFYQNIISIALLVPLLIVLIRHFGAAGAAMNWVILHAGYVLIAPHLMHRRLLKTEKWTWYVRDVAVPAGAIIAIGVVVRLIAPDRSQGYFAQLALLGGVWVMAVLGGVALSANLRAMLVRRWRRMRCTPCCEGRQA